MLSLISFEITDAKTIRFFRYTPEGNGIHSIIGDNNQGKSSIIDSILYALSGKPLKNWVRKGSKTAKVKLELGVDKLEYTIEARIKPDGTAPKLTLKNANGAAMPKAATTIKSLLSSIGIEPDAIDRLSDKEQCDLFLKTVKFNINEKKWLEIIQKPIPEQQHILTSVDLKQSALYHERTDLNREIKNQKASIDRLEQRKANIDIPADLPDAKTLMAEQRKQIEENRQYQVLNQTCNNSIEKIKVLNDEITALEKQIEQKKAVKVGLEAGIKKSLTELAEIKQHDLSIINSKIHAANKLAEFAIIPEMKEDLERIKLNRLAVEQHYNDVKQYKLDLLRDADKPDLSSFTNGELSLSDDGRLFINDIPLRNEGTAMRIKVLCELIAASNPKLKLIILRHSADLLDENSLTDLHIWAQKRGFVILAEKVHKTAIGQFTLLVDEN